MKRLIMFVDNNNCAEFCTWCKHCRPGTNHHIAGELLNYLGKIEITAIHFKGGGPAVVALASMTKSVKISMFQTTGKPEKKYSSVFMPMSA